MIKRYQSDVMATIFSEENRYRHFLKVEIAAAKAHASVGVIPAEDAWAIEENATFTLKDIIKIEERTRHDVVAFCEAVSLHLGPEKKWFHYGLTSTDVVDTALGLTIKEANKHLIEGLKTFINTLEKLAIRYKRLPCIGRTHGIHADITAFGLKFALYTDIFKRHLIRFHQLRPRIELGKISGAVGNFANVSPVLQDAICETLGLESAAISTQVLQRDRLAEYLGLLALIAGSIEQLATEIRHLSRTEVNEVQEAFKQGQKGSSAMPHKKNPIASENMCGCARMMRGYMHMAHENIALWHERDISHSSVERVAVADAVSLLDYMLRRYNTVIENLEINKEQITANIDMTKGVVFSQQVMHRLIDKGLSREDAYAIIQPLCFKAFEEKRHFKTLLFESDAVRRHMDDNDIEACFELTPFLKEVDTIFKRIGIN